MFILMNKIGACTIQQTLWPWVAMELTLLQFLQRLWSRKLIIGLLACKTKCFRGFQYNIRFYWSVQLVTTISYTYNVSMFMTVSGDCAGYNFFDLTLTFFKWEVHNHSLVSTTGIILTRR